MTCTRHCTTFVIGISTRTNHRSITYTPPLLLEAAACTGSSSQITLFVQHHTTYGTILLAFLFHFFNPFHGLWSRKVLIVLYHFQSLFSSKEIRSFTCQHHMFSLSLDCIGCIDWVLDILHTRNSSCRQVLTFHNGSIQFKSTVDGTSSAYTRIKQRISFEIVDNRHHSFRTFAPFSQDCIANGQCRIQSRIILLCFFLVIFQTFHGTGTPMNHNHIFSFRGFRLFFPLCTSTQLTAQQDSSYPNPKILHFSLIL